VSTFVTDRQQPGKRVENTLYPIVMYNINAFLTAGDILHKLSTYLTIIALGPYRSAKQLSQAALIHDIFACGTAIALYYVSTEEEAETYKSVEGVPAYWRTRAHCTATIIKSMRIGGLQ
jgi:hypothetical protein